MHKQNMPLEVYLDRPISKTLKVLDEMGRMEEEASKGLQDNTDMPNMKGKVGQSNTSKDVKKLTTSKEVSAFFNR